jgi:hypothetical protein
MDFVGSATAAMMITTRVNRVKKTILAALHASARIVGRAD